MKAFVPHAQQKRFLVSQRRFRNLCAGRRGGKSKVAGRGFLAALCRDEAQRTPQQRREEEPHQYWCTAPIDELLRIQVRELQSACREFHLKLAIQKSEGVATLQGLGVQIRFRSTFVPKNLVGEDVYGIWWDEAAKSKPEAWDYLEPCLTTTAGWVITSTTPEGQNWYHEQFWRRGDPTDERADPRYENFHFRSAENPYLARICPSCLKSYMAGSKGWTENRCQQDGNILVSEAGWKKGLLPPRVYAREYDASFLAFDGQIWDELSMGTHWQVLPGGTRFKRLVGGQDFNYAKPGAYVLLGEDVSGVWWLLEELHIERLPVWDKDGDCWVKRIQALNLKWEKVTGATVEAIYADPAAPEHVDTEKRQKLPVKVANNAVDLGIQTVAVLLHPIEKAGPRLRWVVEERGGRRVPLARETWRQAATYKFKKGSEEPLKEDDHGCDALRYALHSAVGKNLAALGMVSGRVV